MDLPPHRSQIPLYTDYETQTKVMRSPIGENGRSNLLFMAFDLDNLRFLYRMRYKLGHLKAVYFIDDAEGSETASQRSSGEVHEGAE